jgi:hypothetical protein
LDTGMLLRWELLSVTRRKLRADYRAARGAPRGTKVVTPETHPFLYRLPAVLRLILRPRPLIFFACGFA